jgi:O-antigen/teichoic acid export membrane protein
MKASYKRINQFFKSDTSKILSGSVFPQLLPVIISPFLAKVYSPEDLGFFGQVYAILTVAEVIATGKYENAFFYKNSSQRFKDILITNILFTLLSILLLTLLSFIFKFKNLNNQTYLILAFITLFNCLSGSILINYLLVQKKIRVINLIKYCRSIFISLFSLLLGYLRFPEGMVYGYLIGVCLAVIIALLYLRRDLKIALTGFNLKKYWKVLIDYRDNIIYQMPINFMFNVSLQAPLLLINPEKGIYFLGFYTMSERLIRSPANLVIASISDVYRYKLIHMSDEYETLLDFFKKQLKRLILIGVGPLIIFQLLSRQIVTLLFGVKWLPMSLIIKYLSLMFFFRLLSTPFAVIYIIVNKQRINFYWQIFLLVITCVGIYIGVLKNDFFLSIKLYSIAFCFSYFLYLIITYLVIKAKKGKQILKTA